MAQTRRPKTQVIYENRCPRDNDVDRVVVQLAVSPPYVTIAYRAGEEALPRTRGEAMLPRDIAMNIFTFRKGKKTDCKRLPSGIDIEC